MKSPGKQLDGQPTDADLVAAAVGGDRAAYDVLVGNYQHRLFNTLVRLTGSHHTAEDIAQDAFVQAYRKLSTFQGKSAFYTWLYRIAFNLAMSDARRRRPVTCLEGDQQTKAMAEPADTRDSPQQSAEAREQVELVQAAINQLADEHRQIVVLREIEGCDYQQIAEILEVPVGTVRSRLFRAREQLKTKLAATIAHD